MTRLIVITDVSQCRFLQRQRPDLLDHARVVVVSPLAALHLTSSGRAVTLASNYLAPEEARPLDDLAYELAFSWFKPFQERLIVDNIDLGALTALDNLMFFKQALGADLICRRMIDDIQPAEIFLFGPLNRACADGAAFKDEHDVFEATLLHQAEQRGISCEVLTEDEPHRPLTKKNAGPDIRARRIHAQDLSAKNGRRRTICFSNNWGLLKFLPLLDVLEKTGRYQTVPVNLASEMDLRTTRSGPDGQGLAYISIQDWIARESDPVLEEGPALWKDVRRDIRTHAFPKPFEILNNPHLEFQSDHLFNNWLRTALRWLPAFRTAFQDLSPDLVLVDEHSYFLYRLCAWVARDMAIPCATIPHGNMINYPHYFAFRSNAFLCAGQSMRDAAINTLKIDSGRIFIIGDPELDRLAHNPPETIKFPRPTVFIPDQRYVNYTACQMDLAQYLTAWKDVFAFARNNPEVDVIIKPHPSYGYREWFQDQIVFQRLPNLRLEENHKVEDLMSRSHVTVAVGRISNAGLIALVLGVPLLFYDRSNRIPSYGDYLWHEEPGLLVARDSESFQIFLARLLRMPYFAAEAVEHQRRVIDKHYPGIDYDTAPRIVAACDALTAHTRSYHEPA